ncbi:MULTISPECIES: hypothetical protein [unclassified Paenibacillus]|nr:MULTISPECIES: hypothetical protein [unclassified Paenibacillus]
MIQKGERGERADREVTKHYTDWCKSPKEQISRWCAGIVLVTASSKLLALYKPVTALFTQKIYGCPGKVISGETEGQEWLKVLLQKNIVFWMMSKQGDSCSIAAVFFAFCTGKY